MNLQIKKKNRIKTERLVIKPYTNEDIDDLVELLTNSEITKTFMVPDFKTRDKAVELAKKLVGFSQIDDTNHLEYGIYLAGKLIGFINDCGFENNEIEIGYVVHPDYKGQGYATESVKAVIEDLRDMGFKKVIAGFFEENVASRRVMEKCGMKLNNETDEEEYRGVVHKCLYCELEL